MDDGLMDDGLSMVIGWTNGLADHIVTKKHHTKRSDLFVTQDDSSLVPFGIPSMPTITSHHIPPYGCVWKCCVPIIFPMVLLIRQSRPFLNGYFIGKINMINPTFSEKPRWRQQSHIAYVSVWSPDFLPWSRTPPAPLLRSKSSQRRGDVGRRPPRWTSVTMCQNVKMESFRQKNDLMEFLFDFIK